jgi:hypothetical protein
MKTWGSWGIAPSFLTSAVDGSKWSASRLGRFTTAERAPATHPIGDWVGPGAGLDAVEKRKISCPCRESNPGHSASRPSLWRPSYPSSCNNNVSLYIVTCLLKARIVGPENMAIARERLSKHTSAATQRNNRTIGGGVFYAVRAEAIYRGPKGCHLRIMTKRVLLQKENLW